MPVSASAVLSRELLAAQAATSNAAATAARTQPATMATGAGRPRGSSCRRVRADDFCGVLLCLADITGFLAGAARSGAQPALLTRTLPHALHKKTPRGRARGFRRTYERRPSAPERTPALARALRTLLGLVDAQRPPRHLEAVQGLDGALRFGLRHVDEAEATRLAGLAIVDELYRFHFAMTFKQ